MSFTHNPDLSRAETIPSDWYVSKEILEHEYRSIFNRSWALVGQSAQIKNPGDYFTTTLGRENIVITRNKSGTPVGFFNVCRHRAGTVAKGCGNATSFRCIYHNWTYDLDGQLLITPEFEDVQNFRKEDNCLPKVEVKIWGPLVFAAITPLMSFEEYMGSISHEVAYLELQDTRLFLTKDYWVESNWKTYVDNYLEGYHIPAVHPQLFKELDYKEYKTETFQWHSLQHAPPRKSGRLYTNPDNQHAHYYWLFPNLMFNIYQGVLQTNVVIPEGPHRCRVRFDWFTKGEITPERKEQLDLLAHFSDIVQDEDAEICKVVQSNLGSVSYQSGRYSVKRENGVHHFHSLLAKLLES